MAGKSDELYVRLIDLDFKRIGEALIALPLTTLGLRHASIESSLDYIHPEPGTEAEFVKDLFTLPQDEIIAKWYGGHEFAAQLTAATMDKVLASLLPGGFGPRE